MRKELPIRYCVDWVEDGVLYFKWYKTERWAKAFLLSLVADGISKKYINITKI